MILLNGFPSLNTRDTRKLITRKNIDVKLINVFSEDDITEIFEKAMHRSVRLFGNAAFRKSIPGKRRTPINKSLFETWGVLLSDLSEERFECLMTQRWELFNDYEKMLHDPKFIVAISRDSTRVSSVIYRYNEIKNLIDTYSHD